MPEYNVNYNELGGSRALTLHVKPALAHGGTFCSHVPFRLTARFVLHVKFMLLASDLGSKGKEATESEILPGTTNLGSLSMGLSCSQNGNAYLEVFTVRPRKSSGAVSGELKMR